MEHFLKFANHHVDGCGIPPAIEETRPTFSACGLEDITYSGYFENEFGEQMVILYDSQADQGVFLCGDYGWGCPHLFRCDAKIEKDDIGSTLSTFCECVLGGGEAMWLQACLSSIRFQKKHMLAVFGTPAEEAE